jgi:glucose/arabinose dehydrogenase
MNRSLLSIGLAAILLLATPAAFNFARAQATAGPSVDDENLSVEMVDDGLALPTAMTFVDEDRILVLEKDNGTVMLIEDGELQSEPLLDVAVANENERGMLGIAVSRENATTTYVFLYFTESGGGTDGDDKQGVSPAGNRLYRYELLGDQLVNRKLLLDLPALPGPRYNGGPVTIASDNNVYVIIGDVEGHRTKVQNFEDGPAADGTSGVLRIGKNGELPEPVIGSGTFGKYYFAYGIRNSFGLAFDPETEKLWDTENGPSFGDEINLVDAGFNSGWRDAQGKANQSDLADLMLFNSRSHYSDPEFSWTEPVGPTALAFLNSSKLGEEYQNDMFVGDINNGAVYRFELNGNRDALVLGGALADKVADTPAESDAAVFGTGFGGVTDIKTGPDGNLYVLSFIDGSVFRIVSDRSPEEDNAEDESGTAELTVRSVDLSNNRITGMFTTIRSSDGTIVEEGFTPLTFTGDEGSRYTVTVSDFRNREFDHWDDDTTSKTRTITLNQDRMITAYYGVAINSQTHIIDRLAGTLNLDECTDKKDEQKLRKIIDNMIGNIFSENEKKADQLEKTLDKIIKDCTDDRRQDDNRGRGNSDD